MTDAVSVIARPGTTLLNPGSAGGRAARATPHYLNEKRQPDQRRIY